MCLLNYVADCTYAKAEEKHASARSMTRHVCQRRKPCLLLVPTALGMRKTEMWTLHRLKWCFLQEGGGGWVLLILNELQRWSFRHQVLTALWHAYFPKSYTDLKCQICMQSEDAVSCETTWLWLLESTDNYLNCSDVLNKLWLVINPSYKAVFFE